MDLFGHVPCQIWHISILMITNIKRLKRQNDFPISTKYTMYTCLWTLLIQIVHTVIQEQRHKRTDIDLVHLFSLPIQFETFLASLVASCVFPDQNIFFLLFPGDKTGTNYYLDINLTFEIEYYTQSKSTKFKVNNNRLNGIIQNPILKIFS